MKGKRLLALLLSVMMVVTFMPSIAFAAAGDDPDTAVPAAEAAETEEAAEETTGEDTQAESEVPEVQKEAAGGDEAPAAGEKPAADAEKPLANEDADGGAKDAGAQKGEAAPAKAELVSSGQVKTTSEADIAGNDELVEQFFDAQVGEALGGKKAKSGMLRAANNKRYNKLNYTEQLIYDDILAYLESVAMGETSETVFNVDMSEALGEYLVDSDLGEGFTAITSESLGIDAAVAYQVEEDVWDLTDEAKDSLYDINKIVEAVLIDNPAYAYWYDKTEGYTYLLNASYYSGAEESDLIFTETPALELSFTVAGDYRYEGNEYEFDTSKADKLTYAASKVESIIEENADRSDLEKLHAYKDTICNLTSYNNDAAADEATPYGDPWQLIYVFDDDPETTVVCEGYSKAFQYLCDTTGFSSYDCHTVTGMMRSGDSIEPHMWNILTMDDGRNYIADITNCDSEVYGPTDDLFLKGYTDGSVEEGYEYCYEFRYTYDDNTLSIYDYDELEMSINEYKEGAGPEIEVDHFEFIPAEPIEFIENTNGYMDSEYVEDPETGEGEYKEYYRYYVDAGYIICRTGNKVIVNDTVYTYGYDYDEEGGFYSDEGETINYYDVECSDDQSYSNQWTTGNPGTVKLSYGGQSCDVPVTIKENPVKSIRFVPAEKISFIEGTNGYTNSAEIYNEETEEYEEVEFFSYYTDTWSILYKEGNILYVNDEAYTYGYNEETDVEGFFNSEGEKLDDDYLKVSSEQSYDNQWTPEHPGVITIGYMGQTCEVEVEIAENPVTNISFVSVEPITFMEGVNGYTTSDYVYDQDADEYIEKEYFRYYTDTWPILYKEGNILYVNDEAYTYDYNEETDDEGFFNSEGEKLDDDYLNISSEQSYDNQWTPEHPGVITIEYMGQTCEVPVTITKNPVESISFRTDRTFIENKNGYWREDEDTFEYWLDPEEGDVLTINGEDYVYMYNKDLNERGFFNGNDRLDEVEYYSHQYENPWVIPEGEEETTVRFTVEYMGHSCEAEARLIRNPVIGIEFIPANEYTELVEGVDGEVDEDTNIFYYNMPAFEEGDTLIVKYRDRDDVTYICEREDYFENADDSSDYFYYHDDEIIKRYADQSEPWTVTEGDDYYEMTVEFEGCTVVGKKIRILPNPIEYIAFSRNGESYIELIQGRDSNLDWDWNDDDEREYYDYYQIWFKQGDQVIIKMKDENEPVTYEYRKVRDGRNIDWKLVNIDDNTDTIDPFDFIFNSYQSVNNKWEVGETRTATIKYRGRSADIEVNILKNPITKVEFKFSDGSAKAKVIEEVDGYWVTDVDDDGETNRYFVYEFPEFKQGDAIYITKNGGVYKYEYRETVFDGDGFIDAFVNINDDKDIIPEYDIDEIESNQEEVKWVKDKPADDDYYFEFSYWGVKNRIPAEVVENPVSEIDFSREGYDADTSPIELTEGLDAEINSDGANNRWFEYYLTFKNGDTIRITDPEGATSDYNAVPYAHAEDYINYFENDKGDKIDPSDIEQSSDQSSANQWQPGEDVHDISLEYFNRQTNVKVKIRKNPVQEISFVRPGSEDEPVELTEDSDGYYNGWFFEYELRFQEGDELYITYDGTDDPVKYVAEADNKGRIIAFTAADPVPAGGKERIGTGSFSYRHNRWLENGVEDYIMLVYQGMWTDVPVIVVDNPVESFEYIWAKGGDRRELVENVDGIETTNPDGSEYFWYLMPYTNGDKIKVKYTGSDTAVTYTCKKQNGDYVFVAEGAVPEGAPSLIYEEDIDQDSLQGSYELWEKGNDYELDLVYSGCRFTVPVTIVENICEHEWDEGEVTKAATCNAEGEMTLTCTKCGQTKTEEIAKDPENHVGGTYADGAKDATCISEGYTGDTYCKGCNELLEAGSVIPLAEHTAVVDEETAPTCTETGLTEGSHCSFCGKVLKEQEVVEALGHDWSGWQTVTPATEDAEGKEKRECSRCHEEEERAIPPLSHEHELTAVAAEDATCEEAGHTAYWECTSCGKIFSDENAENEIDQAATVIPAKGHSWDEGKVTKEPTGTEDGVRTYTCAVCKRTREETIPKLSESQAEAYAEADSAEASAEAAQQADAGVSENSTDEALAAADSAADSAVAQAESAVEKTQAAYAEAVEKCGAGSEAAAYAESKLAEAKEAKATALSASASVKAKTAAAAGRKASEAIAAADAAAAKPGTTAVNTATEAEAAAKDAADKYKAASNAAAAAVEAVMAAGYAEDSDEVREAKVALEDINDKLAEAEKAAEQAEEALADAVAKKADLDKTKAGKTFKVSSNTYVVLKNVSGSKPGTVALKTAVNKSSVSIPATVRYNKKTFNVVQINAKSFKGSKISKVTLGKNVKTIKKNAFYGSKATTVTLKTKLLKKAYVKGSLSKSKVTTVKVSVGTKSQNKSYVKKYKKIFTKANAGKKVTVK